MPRPKLWGGSLGPTEVGDRQVRSIPATKAAVPPIPWRKFCTNGASPSAQFVNLLHEATNAAALYRTKEVFAATSYLGTGGGILAGSSAGTRARWRGAFHLGPYSTAVLCRVVCHPQDGLVFDAPSSTLIQIYSDATESTLVASGSFYYGASPTGSASISGWPYLKWGDVYIDGLTANTSYYVRVSDVDRCRTQSISIAELGSMTDNFDGYLPQSLGADSEVLSIYRQNVATLQKNLWKRGGAKVLTWTVDDLLSPISRASATPANILDTTVTTVSAASPGFTFDMRGKDRLSQTSGVPCVMKVSATNSAGTGRIYLKDSTGATVASITNGWTASDTWQSVSFNLPATLARYDIQFDNNSSGTLFVYAVSIYEYEA